MRLGASQNAVNAAWLVTRYVHFYTTDYVTDFNQSNKEFLGKALNGCDLVNVASSIKKAAHVKPTPIFHSQLTLKYTHFSKPSSSMMVRGYTACRSWCLRIMHPVPAKVLLDSSPPVIRMSATCLQSATVRSAIPLSACLSSHCQANPGQPFFVCSTHRGVWTNPPLGYWYSPQVVVKLLCLSKLTLKWTPS